MNPASNYRREPRGRFVAPRAHLLLLASRIRCAVAGIAAAFVLSAASARAAIRVEAYLGEPFGVGRVTVDLPPGTSASPWSDDRFTITESNHRVLYPVIEN